MAECDCKHVQVPTRVCKLAVWERGTRRYLQPAGVRGWLHQLLSSPLQEVEDDDAVGTARARDMSDVFRETAAAYGEVARQSVSRGLRKANTRMARRFEELSRAF